MSFIASRLKPDDPVRCEGRICRVKYVSEGRTTKGDRDVYAFTPYCAPTISYHCTFGNSVQPVNKVVTCLGCLAA